jgi:hypothetical protein
VARARVSFGAWDVGLLAGYVRGDIVAGAFVTGTAGKLRLRGEVVYTYDLEEDLPEASGLVYAGIGNPGGEDAHFARAVLGADYRFDWKRPLTLVAEVYYNGFGRLRARDYLAVARRPRVGEYGEIFNLGLLYAALGATFEPHERVDLSLMLLSNLLDPSLLMTLGLTWKVGNDMAFTAGAMIPVGQGPVLDTATLVMRARTELGVYPYVGYLQWKLYF